VAQRSAAFHLRKYYLDCIGPDGSVVIGYVARLRWGPLSLSYAALLECAADGTRRERHTWSRVPEPVVTGRGLSWECDALGVRGSWQDPTDELDAVLPDEHSGFVQWRVLAPRAVARLEQAGLPPLLGYGYVERLELVLEPWRLPFDTLHWGRFHSEHDVLVWIGWDGEVPLRHCTHNGELLSGASFGERVLSFEPGRELRLTSSRTVHDAPVVAAIGGLPRVLRRVPPSFMAAREVKWVSEARLSTTGRPPAAGWALHERVQFRQPR